MPISEDIENQLGFSDKMYIPEQVLIEWLNLSAIITTYSLVFYNMARSGSLKVHPSLASFISIFLILISTAYMIYSLIPYSKRMTFLANTCKKAKECSDEQYEHIKSITNVYLFLGGLTSAIQLIVTYLIITTV